MAEYARYDEQTLRTAIEHGKEEAVAMMLKADVPRTSDEQGRDPLSLALIHGNEYVANLLLQKSTPSDLNRPDMQGMLRQRGQNHIRMPATRRRSSASSPASRRRSPVSPNARW